MEELQAQGLARHIGLSNIGPNRLRALLASPDLRVRPAVVQVELHPYLQNRELRRLCDARGIRVTAYCSLGSAARPHKYQHAADPVLLREAALQRVAAEARAPVASVALAWALARGVATIPKSTRPERIAANFGAASMRLSAAQLEQIDRLERGHRFLADGWLQYAWRPGQTLEALLDDPPGTRPGTRADRGSDVSQPGTLRSAWGGALCLLALGGAALVASRACARRQQQPQRHAYEYHFGG